MTVGTMTLVLVVLIRGRTHVADGAGSFFAEMTGAPEAGSGATEGSGDAVPPSREPAGAATVRLDVDPVDMAVETARWRAWRALGSARDALPSAPP